MMLDGRPLSLPEAPGEADQHRGGGKDRLRLLAEEFAPQGKLLLRTFDQHERDGFLDIAWQEIDATRYLTPPDCPRTLRSVAKRVLAEFGSFAELCRSDAKPGLQPEWFGPCAQIEEDGFDWSKWNRPWLVPAIAGERRLSPRTSLYVYEGVHSTAVLALSLLSGSVAWKSVDAIICIERPG